MDHHQYCDIKEYLSCGLLTPESLDAIYSQKPIDRADLAVLCGNKTFDEKIAHWLLGINGWNLIMVSERHTWTCPMFRFMCNPNISANVFEIIIQAFVALTGGLQCVSYRYYHGFPLLFWVYFREIGPEMLLVLLKINMELPITAYHINFAQKVDNESIYQCILTRETYTAWRPEWNKLYRILQLLKSFKSSIVLPILKRNTSCNNSINSIAKNSTREMNMIELLVDLSGESFEWIDSKYLSDSELAQTIANAYYNSSWFAQNPDPDQALQHIPLELRSGLRKNGSGLKTKVAIRSELESND